MDYISSSKYNRSGVTSLKDTVLERELNLYYYINVPYIVAGTISIQAICISAYYKRAGDNINGYLALIVE